MNRIINLRGFKYVIWDGIKRFRSISNQLYRTYYTDNFPNTGLCQTIVVSMVDGIVLHGGLTDRLRGIVYTYKWCKKNHVAFRINFTSPFLLETFLVPNTYDWRLKQNELSKSSSVSHPLYVDVMGMHTWEPYMRNFYFSIAMKRLLNNYKQIHVYTNLNSIKKEEYTQLFNELFKPSAFLESAIKKCYLSMKGGRYISISFRFMELLGDFVDDGSRSPLPKSEREQLIDKCLHQIDIIRRDAPFHDYVVVTSDSSTFIGRVSNHPNVYIIPGAIGHMTFAGSNLDIHLKTFLDYYIIANAEKAYMARTGNMYRSGFASHAAMITGIPFEEIVF